ncbi:OPT/YSL family transporter [Myxococcota bacterium]|jgi:OPT family oligopeptide transporter|nr:OPT/YSL family transporter [Myxococcota bacterium]
MEHSAAPASSAAEHGPIDLKTIPEADRDRVWFESYYQGDRVPQLTLRAVLMGGVIGAVMSIANLYTTLKLGWAFGVTITACIISYVVWNFFMAVGLAKSKMSILENNCMQSTAAAAGVSTGGTLATAVGAMLLISGDDHRLGWISVGVWVFLVACLGVFLAIPMKRQMINSEQLTFPSGIAAAETLKSLYAEGAEALQKARALLVSLAVGLTSGTTKAFEWFFLEIPIKFQVAQVGGTTISGAQMAGFTFDPGLLMIAAGMIVGLRVSLSMLIGALVNYLVVMPYVMNLPAWNDSGKFLGHVEAAFAPDTHELIIVKVMRWSLWFGTALMVSAGITSFAMGWRTIARAFQGIGKGGGSGNAAMDAIEVPMKWMIIGLTPITIGLTLLCWFSFHISPWLAVVSVALSFVLAMVACRATGETDTTPIGAMGKITQFIYAVLAPADKGVNLMTAGITAGAAGSAADLLTDLKSGYLLGANPRKQFLAQFFGVFFGTLAVVPAWYALVPSKAALEGFNSPATTMWYAVAEALAAGIQSIPESARYAIVIGGLLGIVLPLVESVSPPNVRKWIPSSMGLGLAFVVPFANALSFFIGALIAFVWMKAHKQTAEKFIVPIASGIVAGESLSAAGFAIGENFGVWEKLGLKAGH